MADRSDSPSPPGPIRVWIEVDLEASPIRGILKTTGGPANPFVGWLGLSLALEGLRSQPQATPEEGSDDV